MLAVTWNGRKVRLFANGKVKGRVMMRHPKQSSCPIYFGAVPHGGGNIGAFKGYIDQVGPTRLLIHNSLYFSLISVPVPKSVRMIAFYGKTGHRK